MLLIYQNKDNITYSYIIQSFPSHTTEIGDLNKRGQTLLCVYFYTKGNCYILGSWHDYYVLTDKLYRANVFDHYNCLKRAVKMSLSNKLIEFAYKLRK